MSSAHPIPSRTAITLAFVCVWFFWGTTFLGMRIAVRTIDPFLLVALRYLIAGSIILAFNGLRGASLRPARADLPRLAITGILILGLGNLGVVWAEQSLSSGLASLLAAAIPIYVTLIEAALPRGERLSPRGWLGIAVGLAGLTALLWRSIHEGAPAAAPHHPSATLLACLVALGAAFTWAYGSVLSRRLTITTTTFVTAGWQMLFGGGLNLILTLLTGGPHRSHLTTQGILATAWLVVCGSLIGFNCYAFLLANVPVAKVATYAYVNPIVAVLLGALLLHERMVPLEFAGMAAILLAVYLVNSSRITAAPAETPTPKSLSAA